MEKIPAYAAELFELIVLASGAGVAAFVGVALERFGFTAVTGGDFVVGIWAAAMGLVALYVGIVALGYEQVLPRLQRLSGAE